MQQSVVKPFTADESVGGAREWEAILLRLIGRSYTATVVKVDAVQPGGTGAVGFLDATDLVQQLDGSNQGIPNVSMRSLPYFRLQGGANAVIIDPKPGDLGIAIFARRDISTVKKTKAERPPPSLRAHDVSDGLYIGGILNGAPSQYLRFLDSGIEMVSAGNVTITSPGAVAINSATLTHNGINIGDTHTHPGVQPGSGSTGTPQ